MDKRNKKAAAAVDNHQIISFFQGVARGMVGGPRGGGWLEGLHWFLGGVGKIIAGVAGVAGGVALATLLATPATLATPWRLL